MSTLLMALFILAVTIIVPWIFIARHKKAVKEKERYNFHRFSTAGTERNLSFTRQEVIQNMILGLDGIQQVLMIAELDNDYDIACIPLKELAACRIDKTYDTTGENTSEKVLKETRLVFDFNDQRVPLYISFYNNNEDSIYLMADKEAKAREWQMAISKLLPNFVLPKYHTEK
jgi:hypothetical protein